MEILASFVHEPTGIEYVIIDVGAGAYAARTRLPDGSVEDAAWASLVDGSTGDYLTSIWVEPVHRRRGVAGALYEAIERDIGRALRPSPRHLSPDARAFWAARRKRHL